VAPDLALPPRLVRRIYTSCIEAKRPPGVRGPSMRKIAGPVRYQTGWWDEKASRDYYYLEDMNGSIHWAYKNNENGTWSFQGFVS